MKKNYLILFSTLFCLISLVFLTAKCVNACTLWGVTGDTVKDGGTLIAKNFDYNPSFSTRLEFVIPNHGYKYLADVLYGSDIHPSVQGGINEKGLVVTSAATQIIKSTLPPGGKLGFNERILRDYDSVDSFLADTEMLNDYTSGFHMIADKYKIVMIEIAPEGQNNIQIVDNGPLYHTNEYCTPSLMTYNEIPSKSSQVRYARIQDLMTTHNGYFTLDDFIAISEDQNDGPYDSLWRTGNEFERTLATWIVHLPADRAPVVYIKTANTGEEIKSTRLTLHKKFWDEQPIGEISF